MALKFYSLVFETEKQIKEKEMKKFLCCKNCRLVGKHRNWLGITYYKCFYAIFDITMPWALCDEYEPINEKDNN